MAERSLGTVQWFVICPDCQNFWFRSNCSKPKLVWQIQIVMRRLTIDYKLIKILLIGGLNLSLSFHPGFQNEKKFRGITLRVSKQSPSQKWLKVSRTVLQGFSPPGSKMNIFFCAPIEKKSWGLLVPARQIAKPSGLYISPVIISWCFPNA